MEQWKYCPILLYQCIFVLENFMFHQTKILLLSHMADGQALSSFDIFNFMNQIITHKITLFYCFQSAYFVNILISKYILPLYTCCASKHFAICAVLLFFCHYISGVHNVTCKRYQHTHTVFAPLSGYRVLDLTRCGAVL